MNEKKDLIIGKSKFLLLAIILVPIISVTMILRIIKWFMPYIAYTYKTTILCIVVVGLIYIMLGVMRYKCKKIESTEKSKLYKVTHFVMCMLPSYIVGLFATGFGLTIVFRFIWTREYYNSPAEEIYYWGFFISLILSAIIYLLCELIVTKSMDEVKRSIRNIPIMIAVILINGLALFIGINASINREVDADKIKYIEFISYDAKEYNWDDKDDCVKIIDEELFKAVEVAYSNSMDIYLSSEFNELYYRSSEHGRIIYGTIIGINQGGTTFYRLIPFEYDIEQYMENLYTYEINEEDDKFVLPEYDTVDAKLSLSGLTSVSFDNEKIYNLLKEDLNASLYDEVRQAADGEVLCDVTIDFEGEKYDRAKIPVSAKTPKTYEYIMNEIQNVNNENISSYIDDVTASGTYFLIFSFICVDGDKVISPGRNYAFDVSEFNKFSKLLNRFENEEGDVFVYIEISNDSDDSIGTHAMSKCIPKDLAEKMCTIMGFKME